MERRGLPTAPSPPGQPPRLGTGRPPRAGEREAATSGLAGFATALRSRCSVTAMLLRARGIYCLLTE